MLVLVADGARRSDFEAAEAPDDDDPPSEPAAPDAAMELAFAGLSLREAATRALGC